MSSRSAAKHCMVTPQFNGLTKNGGIGTHAYFFSRFLKNVCGFHLTVLYTGPALEAGGFQCPSWIDELVIAEQLGDGLPTLPPLHWAAQRSLCCYEWLKEQPFAAIHFQDWQANGFHAIQAKRTGAAFAQTELTLMINGPTRWTCQGNCGQDFLGRDDVLLDYLESYAARFADHTLAPSQYAAKWAGQNWGIDENKIRVLPYLYESPIPAIRPDNHPKRLIFFGRLENRKGLDLFLKALPLLGEATPITDVHFIGAPVPDPLGDTTVVIRNFFQEHSLPQKYHIVENLGHLEALEKIASLPDGMVVLASRMETLGFTALESITAGFNVIAARASAFVELFQDGPRLFELTPRGLASAVERATKGELPPVDSRLYDIEEVRGRWSRFIGELSPASVRVSGVPYANRPMVDICIPYFNAGSFIEAALDALTRQTYPNFRVIVCDDASTEPASQDAFVRLLEKYAPHGWLFVRNETNAGAGQTRNRCAASGSAPLLLFFDADNVPLPDMVESMVEALLRANLDSVGCFYGSFAEWNVPTPENITFRFAPLGPALITALHLPQLLGETNMLIRREVFEQLNGFPIDRRYGHEDFEMLTRLVIRGFNHDIIPRILYYYRRCESGNLASTPLLLNRVRSLRPFFEDLQSPCREFVSAAFFVHQLFVPNATPHKKKVARTQRKMVYRTKSHAFERSWVFHVWWLFRQPRKAVIKTWNKFKRLWQPKEAPPPLGFMEQVSRAFQERGVTFQAGDTPARFKLDGTTLPGMRGLGVTDVELLVALLELIKPNQVLSIGDPMGWNSMLIAKMVPGLRVRQLWEAPRWPTAWTRNHVRETMEAVDNEIKSHRFGDAGDLKKIRQMAGNVASEIVVIDPHAVTLPLGIVFQVLRASPPAGSIWLIADGEEQGAVRDAVRKAGMVWQALPGTASRFCIVHDESLSAPLAGILAHSKSEKAPPAGRPAHNMSGGVPS